MLLMSGIGILIILLFVSSIPAIAAFVWFRLAHYPFSPLRFSLVLLTGAASFFPALFLQKIFIVGNGILPLVGKGSLLAEIFARIALTEELSRLIMLLILFFIIRRFSSGEPPQQPERTLTGPQDPTISAAIFSSPAMAGALAGAAGLIAGFGFAILESAVYGASNPDSVLLRIFTAAPLHGACGFRIGSCIALFRKGPGHAFFRFLSAVVIHGIYNLMLVIPGIFPSITAILIALSALTSSILAIRSGMKGR